MIKMRKVPRTIIVYELLFGIFEIISGFGISLFGKSLLGMYEHMQNAELVEDPNDLFVKIGEKLIPNLFQHRYYIGFFLLAFGIIKLTSAIGMSYKKEWAEHLLIIFLIILMPFELVEELFHFSLIGILYLGINIFIVLYLVEFKPIEYQKRLTRYIRK